MTASISSDSRSPVLTAIREDAPGPRLLPKPVGQARSPARRADGWVTMLRPMQGQTADPLRASAAGTADSPDPLTAPADAIPRRNPGVLTLGGCWRAFIRRPSPPLLAAAFVAALALRIVLGSWDWRDLVVAGAVIALTPVTEWA